MPRLNVIPEFIDDPAIEQCDPATCEHLEVADRFYFAVTPTHSHAHHMNADPCGYCEHGQRYHLDDKCGIEDCDCMGHQ